LGKPVRGDSQRRQFRTVEVGALAAAKVEGINSDVKGDGGTTTRRLTVPGKPLRDRRGVIGKL
jgi:hypothetical protein